MDENNGVLRFLKWVGIIAIVALPFAILFRKRKTPESHQLVHDDDSNIFASELED